MLEHVLDPHAALKNCRGMLDAGGHLLVVTPFIYKVHPCPVDAWRWTRVGLERSLSDAGFTTVTTGSWGNRACIGATLRKEYRRYNRYLHSLANDPELPVVVWAVASG